jgi:hypothetical protein
MWRRSAEPRFVSGRSGAFSPDRSDPPARSATSSRRSCAARALAARSAGGDLVLRATRTGARRWPARHSLDDDEVRRDDAVGALRDERRAMPRYRPGARRSEAARVADPGRVAELAHAFRLALSSLAIGAGVWWPTLRRRTRSIEGRSAERVDHDQPGDQDARRRAGQLVNQIVRRAGRGSRSPARAGAQAIAAAAVSPHPSAPPAARSGGVCTAPTPSAGLRDARRRRRHGRLFFGKPSGASRRSPELVEIERTPNNLDLLRDVFATCPVGAARRWSASQ